MLEGVKFKRREGLGDRVGRTNKRKKGGFYFESKRKNAEAISLGESTKSSFGVSWGPLRLAGEGEKNPG